MDPFILVFQQFQGILAMLFSGNFPGYSVMGFEEDSAASVSLLNMHETLSSIPLMF